MTPAADPWLQATAAIAIAYAARGWPVLPVWWPLNPGTARARCACRRGPACPNPAKHPLGRLVPHGLNDATTDPATVARWWARYPHANLGIATGFAFDVIDVDGPEGLRSLAAWDTAGHRPQILGIATTGRDVGWHLYVPPSGRGNAAQLSAGLDYRGAGGYVLAPPSLHVCGRRYTWAESPLTAKEVVA